MGGAVSAIGQGLGAVVTGGTSLIPGSPTRVVGDTVGSTLTLGASGQPNKLIPALGGNQGYTPQTLPQSDPAMQLAESGGAPLLTNVALGANVDDALAGYFGRTSGDDFKAWLAQQSPDKQAAIAGIKNQLTQIQSNTTLRNQAVQNVVNDFPNIATQAATRMQQEKQAAGEEFDSVTKGYMDQVLKGVTAKYAAGGSISSGAATEAEAKAAAQMGLQRLDYTTGRGDVAYSRATDEGQNAWMARYNEVNALRGFQQKMLGQGASQGFSAAQTRLGLSQQTNEFNATAANQLGAAKMNQQGQLFGAIGGIAGTALGGYFQGKAIATGMQQPKAPPAISERQTLLNNSADVGAGA